METHIVVLELSGVQWATSKADAESTLLRLPGVLRVEANLVSQTAQVSYNPELTSQSFLQSWIIDCGFHCAGQSVPKHVCDPLIEGVVTPPIGVGSDELVVPTATQHHTGEGPPVAP